MIFPWCWVLSVFPIFDVHIYFYYRKELFRSKLCRGHQYSFKAFPGRWDIIRFLCFQQKKSFKRHFKAFVSRSNILWTYLIFLLQYAVHETSFSNPFLKLPKSLNPYPKSWPEFWSSEFWPWILIRNPKNECYPYFNPESCTYIWAQIWPLIMTQYWPLMQALILSLKVALKSFTYIKVILLHKRCILYRSTWDLLKQFLFIYEWT